jgi:hypothetical protein
MPSLVSTTISHAVYYYFYEIFKTIDKFVAVSHQKEGIEDGSIGMFSSLISATFSGCLNVLMTNPIWVFSNEACNKLNTAICILEFKILLWVSLQWENRDSRMCLEKLWALLCSIQLQEDSIQ